MPDKTYTQVEVDEIKKGLFTQEALNHHVQERLARESSKYANYEELVKFKTEHEKAMEGQQQKDLEAGKKYDEAKANMEKQIVELQGVISKKDGSLSNMKINHALVSELATASAYIDESVALMTNQAFLDTDGAIKIKGVDGNGLEIKYSVKDGVKTFLESRPHLVKANNKGGGGTPPGNTGGSSAPTDLMSLNIELQQAMASGDNKGITEARNKMSAFIAAKKAV